MEKIDTKTIIISVVLSFVTAFLTSFVNNYFYKNRELELKINEQKRIRYAELMTSLKKGFLSTRLNNSDIIENKRLFLDQSNVVWLYASDNVVSKLNNFLKAFLEFDDNKSFENTQKARNCLKELAFEMRKDITGKTDLTAADYMY